MTEQPCEYCGQQAEIYCSHTWNHDMAECGRLVCAKCAQLNDWHITPTGSPDNETLCPEHLEGAEGEID